MNKHIGIILGRGIEGCGVTKFTLELDSWAKTNGYTTYIVATKDKTWTRKNAHEFSNVDHIKLSSSQELSRVTENLNKCDYVICNSLPSKGHNKDTIDHFAKLVTQITCPFVLIQHDHKAASIRRNECLSEVIDKACVIFTHSRENDFAKIVKNQLGIGGLNSFFGEEPTKILNFQPGMNFDLVREKYWKSIDEHDPFHHKWIGRTTSWKGYLQMFIFHKEYLQKHNCLTSLEGIERSPAYLGFRELGEFDPHVTSKEDTNSIDISQKYGKCLQVFGPYIHDEMLERMSRCGFGYQLSAFQQPYIERSIEYTHCEIVCTGVIPVFRKTYGQHCHHRISGDPLIETKDNGTIWLGDNANDMAPAFELIKQLESDSKQRDDYREMAYEFYRNHQDSKYTFKELFDNIEKEV